MRHFFTVMDRKSTRHDWRLVVASQTLERARSVAGRQYQQTQEWIDLNHREDWLGYQVALDITHHPDGELCYQWPSNHTFTPNALFWPERAKQHKPTMHNLAIQLALDPDRGEDTIGRAVERYDLSDAETSSLTYWLNYYLEE